MMTGQSEAGTPGDTSSHNLSRDSYRSSETSFIPAKAAITNSHSMIKSIAPPVFLQSQKLGYCLRLIIQTPAEITPLNAVPATMTSALGSMAK